ncbi:unnamed protein product, partial [Mesorhabditis spiculigera]
MASNTSSPQKEPHSSYASPTSAGFPSHSYQDMSYQQPGMSGGGDVMDMPASSQHMSMHQGMMQNFNPMMSQAYQGYDPQRPMPMPGQHQQPLGYAMHSPGPSQKNAGANVMGPPQMMPAPPMMRQCSQPNMPMPQMPMQPLPRPRSSHTAHSAAHSPYSRPQPSPLHAPSPLAQEVFASPSYPSPMQRMTGTPQTQATTSAQPTSPAQNANNANPKMSPYPGPQPMMPMLPGQPGTMNTGQLTPGHYPPGQMSRFMMGPSGPYHHPGMMPQQQGQAQPQPPLQSPSHNPFPPNFQMPSVNFPVYSTTEMPAAFPQFMEAHMRQNPQFARQYYQGPRRPLPMEYPKGMQGLNPMEPTTFGYLNNGNPYFDARFAGPPAGAAQFAAGAQAKPKPAPKAPKKSRAKKKPAEEKVEPPNYVQPLQHGMRPMHEHNMMVAQMAGYPPHQMMGMPGGPPMPGMMAMGPGRPLDGQLGMPPNGRLLDTNTVQSSNDIQQHPNAQLHLNGPPSASETNGGKNTPIKPEPAGTPHSSTSSGADGTHADQDKKPDFSPITPTSMNSEPKPEDAEVNGQLRDEKPDPAELMDVDETIGDDFCPGCNGKLQKDDLTITCGVQCGRTYHKQCSSLNDRAYFHIRATPGSTWICDECYRNSNEQLENVCPIAQIST